MPIDEGVNIDLQFLILEVKKQARASLSVIEHPTGGKLKKIHDREDYVDNLKNTLENKCYFNIHQLDDGKRQMNNFRALITIGSNLERCADFFEHIAEQMSFVDDPECFIPFNLKRYYKVIEKALDIIHPALINHDLTLAQQICDYEQELDDLYKQSFDVIRSNFRRRIAVDDMLSLLFITRYLERVGDSFLNIGEAILDIHVGEKMGIKQFRNLRQALEAQSIDISSADIEFRPIMNTRSGSRVAKIIHADASNQKHNVFYKEGSREKIDKEVAGLKLWQSLYPGRTPKILWHDSRANHATILLEYIQGDDLLEILINQQRPKAELCLKLLTKTLRGIWQSSIQKKSKKTDYINQLLRRKSDVQLVHDHLFDLEEDIDMMLEEAARLESKLKAPFSTLQHGDFNVDNIIFSTDSKKMFFIDVHRSGYGDYTQDVSVFLVSNFRVPIFSPDIRQRLNEANLRVYDCALRFARKNNDTTFEARLALGLFRSLITSTRFLFDSNFSTAMFRRAMMILRDVLANKDHLDKYRLPKEHFLYG